MSPKITCYLRTRRMEWGLSQEDLARLVPGSRRERVSEIETERRHPSAKEMVAFAFIFGQPPQAIFPRFIEEILGGVMHGAAQMDKTLRDDVRPIAVRKLALIGQLASRPELEALDLSL